MEDAKRNKRFCGLFALYLLVLFRITVFRPGFLHPNWLGGTINLQVWISYSMWARAGLWRIFWFDFLGNIFCFVPFGLWLGRRQVPFPLCMAAGLGLSLLIEILQFVLGTGISDVDDLLLNTIGVLLGWILFLLCRRISQPDSRH